MVELYSDPSIEDLKRLQRELNLGDVHVAWFSDHRFVMAHTDDERAVLANLEDCEIHRWAAGLDEPPHLGYAIVKRGADGRLTTSHWSVNPWRTAPRLRPIAPGKTTMVELRYFYADADTPDGMVSYSRSVPVSLIHKIIETIDEVSA